MFPNMNNNFNNNINLIPNMNNNMNMNMMPNINNNMNLIPNMNINQINNNNMNFMNQMYNNNNINMNQINNNMNNIQNMQMMEQIQPIQDQMQMIDLNNNLNNDKLEEQDNIKKEINNYFNSKLYEIDFKRIEAQNEHFKNIKDKLMNHIHSLEKIIEFNNKIMNDYLRDANNITNYKNLLDLSCSVEDIYEDKLNELILCVNEITELYNKRIEELKKNYLNDFNKRYNFHIEDGNYIGFRNLDLQLISLNQLKFNELCKINFNNISELELQFEDDIDIKALTKVSYHNITFLGLYGKIKDIKTLSKLPFKFFKRVTYIW